MSKTISVRLEDEVSELLEDVAKETERSRSFHIQKAIKMYLEDFADAQIALDRLRDQYDPVISGDDMRKKVGL